jgi:flagellar basal-body rod protein FlgC
MDLFKLFSISAAGMNAQRSRMSVISGNLANVETTRTPEGGPYRRRDIVLQAVPLAGRFSDVLAENADESTQGLMSVEVADIKRSDRPPRLNFDPNHPDADANGYVALPDINVMEEMVDLMAAVRSYEANLTAYNATKNLVRRLLDMGRAG